MRCDAMLDGRRVISAHAVPSCKLLHVARPFANAHARRRLGADDVMLGARFGVRANPASLALTGAGRSMKPGVTLKDTKMVRRAGALDYSSAVLDYTCFTSGKVAG